MDQTPTKSSGRRGRPPGSFKKVKTPTTTPTKVREGLASTPSRKKQKTSLASNPASNGRDGPTVGHARATGDPPSVSTDRHMKLPRRKKSLKAGIGNARNLEAGSGEEQDFDELQQPAYGTPSRLRKKTAGIIGTVNDSEPESLQDSIEARDASGASALDSDEGGAEPGAQPSATPRGRKRRKDKQDQQHQGRGQRSPTPPQFLSAHEQYFWQNRPGRAATSNNTLPPHLLLDHEKYFETISTYQDPHAAAYGTLHSIHLRSLPQWAFELSQDFNICLYGYGSKRRLVTEFGTYLHSTTASAPKVLIINGYTPNLDIRQVLNTLATLVFDEHNETKHDRPSEEDDLPNGVDPNEHPTLHHLGSHPREMVSNLLSHLTINPPSLPIYIFINSLDAAPLRRQPNPTLLALLAAHPSIHVLATCDTPSFPLLWDANLRAQYNWVFHDTTTFTSYGGVEVPHVVDDVNELLGRSRRGLKGRDGAGFVLKSLNENARKLYRLLLEEVLISSPNELDGADLTADIGFDAVNDDDPATNPADATHAVDRKHLYQKAQEDFICSNEMQFGQLLKEFFDHDMLHASTTRRQGGNVAEMLAVPFRRDECEALLEELVI